MGFRWNSKILQLLTSNKQQSLHLYYVTSNHGSSDDAAIAYRANRDKSSAFSSRKAFNELYRITIGAATCVGFNSSYSDLKEFTKKIPQLGKKLRDYYLQKMLEQNGKKRKYKKEVRVLSLARQEVDVDKLAQVMVMIAKDMKASKD